MQRKRSKLVLTAFILTLIHIVFMIFVACALMFNWFGVVDALDYILNDYLSYGVSVDTFLSSYYFEVLFVCVVNFFVARFYFKGYKYAPHPKALGRYMIFCSITQLLFSAYIPGIFALIAGIILNNSKIKVVHSHESENSPINDRKLEVMSEAVTRLNELRASGAISEEEYYANLNKILES